MTKINKALFKKCKFKAIQPAINASSNNDRVVIMPGLYTEPKSRKAPLNDPSAATRACSSTTPAVRRRRATSTRSSARTIRTSCTCRAARSRATRSRPRWTNRQGIPKQELGACVRCNLQVEGSGPKPTDVIIDAGEDYDGKGIDAKPAEHAKHVVFRVDRADGFVGRNILFRGGLEFGFYVEETDGVLLDKTKFFWNADYGHLSLHHRPRGGQELRRLRLRRLRRLPGRGAGDRRPGRRTSIPTRRASTRSITQLRPARLRARLLRLDGQRRPHHQQPHLRQHDGHRLGHAVVVRPPRLPGRLVGDRPQLHLLQQLQRLRDGLAGQAARDRPRRHRHRVRRHEHARRSTTTGSSTTGATARCCSRSRTR